MTFYTPDTQNTQNTPNTPNTPSVPSVPSTLANSNLTGYTTHDDTPLSEEDETVIKDYTSAENGVKDISKDVIKKAKKMSMTSNVSFEQALQKLLMDTK